MNFTLILPEIALAALAILLIALDLALPEDRKRVLAWVGAVGLIVPAALVASMAGRQEVSFYGTYVVDNLSTFFQLIFLFAAALVLLSGAGYIEKRSKSPGEFYALVLFSTLGMLFMAGARELITLYVSLELTSIMLYILAGYLKRDLGSTEAGLKYLLLGALSSTVLLYGIALLYGASQTTVLPDIATRIQPNALAIVAAIMIAAGFGFKVAMVPFQLWVPDVYQGAPTPATAFISVASKAAGFVVLLRVFETALTPLDGVWPSLFAVLAAITMTVGNVGALRQTNVKRLLGYSSIGQAGYALMGLAAASTQTASALVFFIFAYALTNLGVFAAVTHISDRLDSDEVEAYNGLSQRAPVLALAMTLCLLSLVGMPPLAGFWSKVNLFYNVFSQGQVALVLIALLNAAIGAYYYLKIVHAVYMKPAPIDKPLPGAFPVSLALAVAVAAVLVVGVMPGPFIGFATAAAAAVHP